uniref:Bone morphogenetic protein 16 n=1 Tax=Oreochromis niloticus TaxID=8128 RepID=A0A669F846_ORENI
MATPVPVLRLPKGPDPNSRGFDPNSPRFIALCRTSISSSAASDTDSEQLQKEQHARSVLREGFLRCLLSMTNKKVQFQMYENVKVEATFGASDIDVLNFQSGNFLGSGGGCWAYSYLIRRSPVSFSGLMQPRPLNLNSLKHLN